MAMMLVTSFVCRGPLKLNGGVAFKIDFAFHICVLCFFSYVFLSISLSWFLITASCFLSLCLVSFMCLVFYLCVLFLFLCLVFYFGHRDCVLFSIEGRPLQLATLSPWLPLHGPSMIGQGQSVHLQSWTLKESERSGPHNGRTVAPEAILFESPCRAHPET